jgi:O-antigen ligase
MVGHFPLLGAGLNAFATAFPRYQTLWPGVWFGEAHNEYLQALLDMGLVGAALAGVLFVTLFRGALAAALRGPLDAGLFGSLVGAAVHATVDFNWQIPANAATFVALAGLTLRRAASASAEDSLPGAAAGRRTDDESLTPRSATPRIESLS